MAGINKVILVGNLGAKPEIKYASNGNAISNLSVSQRVNRGLTKVPVKNKRERSGIESVYLGRLLKSLDSI